MLGMGAHAMMACETPPTHLPPGARPGMDFSPREIDVAVDQDLAMDISEEWMMTTAREALEVALPDDAGGQVSLLLSDDDTVRALNRRYRGLDDTTDVLSFSTEFAGHWEGDESDQPPLGEALGGFVMPPGHAPPLGEVIISWPQTRRQAAEKGWAVERELALLIVHGVLHLMGFDHLEPADAKVMQGKEREAFAAIFQSEAAAQ